MAEQVKHAPGPWGWWPHSCGGVVTDTHAGHVAVPSAGPAREANAERIVACVNACEGIDVGILQSLVKSAQTPAVRLAGLSLEAQEAMRRELAKAEGRPCPST